MKFLYGIIIAFSMYSKIPMPKIEWSKERMEYVMCFFPLVGVVLAVLTWASGSLWFSLRPGDLLRAVVGACLPILVTGGIHLDGFLDVVDARASWQTPERRREILKDPHTGAFAIIWACVYFCAYVGCITELKLEYYLPFGGVFVAVRALSGLSVVLFPKASETGLAATFSKGAKKTAVTVSMLVYLALTAAFWLYVCPAGSWVCIPVLAVLFLYYYRVSVREFGGITGDLAGYFLQLGEIGCLAALTVLSIWR